MAGLADLPRVLWRMSPHEDHRAHAFHELKEGYSESLCEVSFPTNELGADEDPKCVVCIYMHGRELAERRMGHADRWQG